MQEILNKVIKDPIHGFIDFNGARENELKDLLSDSFFQRLRRVKQLGFSDYVFPSAAHSRFAHSLGVYKIAKRMLTIIEPEGSSGKPTLIKPRSGQGAFRLTITDSYERRCAVSGEKTLPILDAAHIRAFEAGGEHAASNGLLLRTDIHRLFDLGYVTVSPDRRFEVSGRLKADFDNGRHYYDLHGTPIRAPKNRYAAPSADALSWH